MPYATNEGVRIHYQLDGNPDGLPVVLHCGFTGTLRSWYDNGYVDALRDDYRLILLDPRGHGESDKPHDPVSHAYDRRVGDVLAVLDAAGIAEAVFWGYSMGGRVGFAAASAALARFRGFIIGGMHPYAPTPENTAETPLLRQGMAHLVAAIEQHAGPLPPAVRERLLTQDADALVASNLATAEAPSFAESLADLRVPMLVYVGTLDTAYHDLAQRATAGQGQVTFVSLPELNHMAGFTRTDVVLPLAITFLAGLSS